MAKWVLPAELYQENALKLRDDHVSRRIELFAPTILSIEVTNALWKAAKLKRLSRQDAQEALKTLGNLNISIYETDWIDAAQILDIASNLDTAIYDATYLFLAHKIKAPFVTSDNKLYERAKRDFEVLHVKEYGTIAP